MIKNVISVIDGAAGSCGKGKVIGELATDKSINISAAITNCMPNAGHTYVSNRGKKFVFRNIPVSSVNPKTELLIGPGSAIDMDIFVEEYEAIKDVIGDRKIYVHELVPLIKERHRQYEREHVKTGSTFKGCGPVGSEKLMREPILEFFKGYKNAVVCSNDEFIDRKMQHVDRGDSYVILEGSQGCDLDLNHSGNNPHTTSRNVGTTQLLSDSGLPAESLLGTIMVIRPFPIRISNITKSGEFIYTGGYGTGIPLTWTQINIAAATGSYPYPGDVECHDYELTLDMIERLISQSNEIALKQVFGPDFKLKKSEEVTLLEALELERLINKRINQGGENVYESEIISLPDSGYVDNGIVYIEDLSEQTTVTKMERRVFDLDIRKLQNNCFLNKPYGLYLNFFQHLGLEYRHEKGKFENYHFSRYLREYINWLEYSTNVDILALGTGARNGERILKQSLIRR